jgi:hypothetical protein
MYTRMQYTEQVETNNRTLLAWKNCINICFHEEDIFQTQK